LTEAFDATYAAAYDSLYESKDYVTECDLLEEVFRTYGNGPIKDVLDLGCGTGSHAMILATRGYRVSGVDSSPHMLAQANRKALSLAVDQRPTFVGGDIRSVDLERQFDAVVIMFAVLGYQLTNEDVRASLTAARKHLKTGGILAFDVWYGPAVLHERPSHRFRTVRTANGETLRASSGELDVNRHLCHVNFRIWTLEGDRLVSASEENHTTRFFFPLELEFFLQTCGFAPIRLGAFPEFRSEASENTWNVLQTARAV
jgi:SAM-dependent methyltransferase